MTVNGDHHHSTTKTATAASSSKPRKKYFCPMCDGVESDTPGNCPKCGMALERNPLQHGEQKTVYTCRRSSRIIPAIARNAE